MASVYRNPSLGAPPSEKDGPGRDEFPSLPAKAPFLWKYLGKEYDMEFIGGLIGIRQEPQTLRLRPEIGWVVREARTGRQSQQDRNPFEREQGFI